MSVETSLPWPSSIPELKRLDELLRCGICYEFMSTSMVTVCSHNYCSLCIRQYLGYKTQCPACFQETTCQQLRNNRLLDEIILLFPGLRDKTARQCQSVKGNSISGYLLKDGESSDGGLASSSDVNMAAASGRPSSPDVRGGAKERDVFASPSKSAKELLFSPRSTKSPLLAETPKRGFSNSPMKSPLHTLPSPSVSSSRLNLSSSKGKTPGKLSSSVSASQSSSSSVALTQSGRQSVSGFFSIINDRTSNNGNPDEPRVACPVCNVQVPERNINLHLDACLKRMEEGEKEDIYCVKQIPKRKPMPKLVYSLLNEKQMRQKLKEIGLSVQGDRQQLVNRHKRYTILYNAECDVSEPRPVSELLRQVEREEREETKATVNKSIFTYDRKTAPEIIEKEQVTYLKKNESHFSKLIADVKKRQEEAKKRRALKEESLTEEKQIVPGTSKASSNHKQNAREGLVSPGTSKSKLDNSRNNRLHSSPGNSKSKPDNSRNNRLHSNHHMLSSSDDDSDTDFVNVKVKASSNGSENKNSLWNFFQNSPKKSSPSVHEKAVSVSNVKLLPRDSNKNVTSSEEDIEEFFENGIDDMLFSEENSFTKLPTKESDKCTPHKKHSHIKSLPNENDDESLSNEERVTNRQEEDNTTKSPPNKTDAVSLSNEERITNEPLTHEHSISNKMEAESINASPDIFSTSQTNSNCSDASESLLRDQEDIEEDLPATVPFIPGKVGCDIEEEELIPGRQPESCPVDDLLLEAPTSPQVGHRTTRNSRSSSQKQQQDLSALGPETQYFGLETDSQLDPEYKPSQEMEDLDADDLTPETSRKPTRRSTRKRQVNEEGTEMPKRRRKRK